MKKYTKKILALLLAVSLFALAGCGGNKDVATNTDFVFEKTLEDGYPIADNETVIDWWIAVNTDITGRYGSLEDAPFAKMLEEKTGVKINFIHPSAGQEATQFNIMLTSGEMPDIITYNWATYANGGWSGAINDNLIIPINSILENGGAPALKAILDSDPVWEKDVITDEGWIAGFPCVAAESQVVYNGPMIRKDLLDKAGLDIPETIEELEEALYAFKEMGIKIPLEVELGKHMVAANAVTGGFGIGASYYVDNGEVKYGPAEPEFKEFLATMNKWYKDGLYDREFSTLQGSERFTSEVLNGNVGVAFASNGGQWGEWLPALEETHPEIEFVTMPFPTVKKGTKAEFGHMENRAGNAMSAITRDCKNVELAAKLLDYAYTDEGHLNFNYGLEERDWYRDDEGIIRFTDLITDVEKNGNQSVSTTMGQHTSSGTSGMSRIQDEGIYNVLFSRDVQKTNIEIWKDTNMAQHQFPNVQYTSDEAQELGSIKTSIETHMHEMMYKFIAGTESLDNWDTYLKAYDSIGLPRALKIMQDAYDRYLERDK